MQETTQALLTRQDVAKRLRVSLRTVDQLSRTGQLPRLKVGRSVRFTEGVLRDYERRVTTV